MCPPGGKLPYFHTYVDSGHFWGFKILNLNTFWVFRKKFGGLKKLWILFGGFYKMDFLGGHFYIFYGFFLKVKVQESQISNIFCGMPDIFFRLTVDAGSRPTCEEKLRVPPTHTGKRIFHRSS